MGVTFPVRVKDPGGAVHALHPYDGEAGELPVTVCEQRASDWPVVLGGEPGWERWEGPDAWT